MIDPAEAARKKRRHRNERIVASLIVLAVAAATAWTAWFQRRATEEVQRDLRYIPKTTPVTPEIAMLREYVRIDTSTPQGVAAGARWLHAELAKRGVRAELIESTEGRLNVYARIEGRKPGEGLLLFNHIDVVPPGDGWTKEPFGGEIELNQLHGRGALDMKGVAVAQLLAFTDVARSGRAPEHDLVFLATAEEEQGSHHGMLWLLQHRPDLFADVRYGVTEGGLTEVMSETMTFFGIEVGGKQLVRVTLTAAGEEPLRQARFVLQRWIARREPDRVLAEVRQYFRDVAPTRVSSRRHLEDIDGSIARGEVWRLPPGYRDFMQDSLWVSAPFNERGQWTMTVRMVNLPDSEPAERVAWLRGRVEGLGVAVRVDESTGPVPLTPSNTPLFRVLAAEARKRYGVEAGVQVLFRSQTDCRHLRTRGLLCYGVAPFPVDIFQSKSIHGRDERIRLDWFLQGVGYMRDAVRAWASSTER